MNWFRFRSFFFLSFACFFMFRQSMSHPSEPNTIQIIPAIAYTTTARECVYINEIQQIAIYGNFGQIRTTKLHTHTHAYVRIAPAIRSSNENSKFPIERLTCYSFTIVYVHNDRNRHIRCALKHTHTCTHVRTNPTIEKADERRRRGFVDSLVSCCRNFIYT